MDARPSRTFITVNMPPISIGPNCPVPVIMGKVLGGRGIDISAMSAMPRVPIAMAPGAARSSALAQTVLRTPMKFSM